MPSAYRAVILAAVVPLILLPGTACDARLFAPQRAAFPDLQVIDWPEPTARESLHDCARRIAGSHPFPADFVLGGVSLGSMVAQELALLLRPRKLLLIATARDRDALRRSRWINPFVQLCPAAALRGRFPAACITRAATWRGVDPACAACVADMFASAHPGHVRWALSAIASWTPPETLPCPTARIHGRRDSTILLGRETDDLTVIDNGGHLINLTHADLVNEWIRAQLG